MKTSNHKIIIDKIKKYCEEIKEINNDYPINGSRFMYTDGKQQMAQEILDLIKKLEL